MFRKVTLYHIGSCQTDKRWGFNSRLEQNISLFTSVSSAALRTTQPFIKWTMGGGGESSFLRCRDLWGMKLPTHLDLLPKLRDHISSPPCFNGVVGPQPGWTVCRRVKSEAQLGSDLLSPSPRPSHHTDEAIATLKVQGKVHPKASLKTQRRSTGIALLIL